MSAASLPNMAGLSGDARAPASRGFSAEGVSRLLDHTLFADFPVLDLAPAPAGVPSGFSLTLPIPPSANALFKNVWRGRARTSAYDTWIATAGYGLRQAAPAPLPGRYGLMLSLPRRMRGDISNRVKAVEDLLVKHGLIRDDRFSDWILIRRSDDVTEATCAVCVFPSIPATNSAAPMASAAARSPSPRRRAQGGAEASTLEPGTPIRA